MFCEGEMTLREKQKKGRKCLLLDCYPNTIPITSTQNEECHPVMIVLAIRLSLKLKISKQILISGYFFGRPGGPSRLALCLPFQGQTKELIQIAPSLALIARSERIILFQFGRHRHLDLCIERKTNHRDAGACR